MTPLLMPALSTLALFLFIWTWNEFLIPLILVNDDAYRTLPIGMLFFQGRYTVNTPVLTAGAVVVVLRIIVVYMIFQRKFIESLTAGSTRPWGRARPRCRARRRGSYRRSSAGHDTRHAAFLCKRQNHGVIAAGLLVASTFRVADMAATGRVRAKSST